MLVTFGTSENLGVIPLDDFPLSKSVSVDYR